MKKLYVLFAVISIYFTAFSQVGPTSSVLSGDATICAGSSTNLSVAVTGGDSPYTVTVSDGTNNYTATGTSPVIISVSPIDTSTYSIVSVMAGGVAGTGNSGTATVNVNPSQPLPTGLACYETVSFDSTIGFCEWIIIGDQPEPPALECYQTATFNTTSCVWDVSGTQPAEPTLLPCYETAAFDISSCTWVVGGTQPEVPTVACYETATFNTTTCLWEISVTQ